MAVLKAVFMLFTGFPSYKNTLLVSSLRTLDSSPRLALTSGVSDTFLGFLVFVSIERSVIKPRWRSTLSQVRLNISPSRWPSWYANRRIGFRCGAAASYSAFHSASVSTRSIRYVGPVEAPLRQDCLAASRVGSLHSSNV